jgi:hypothetical protein
MSVRPLSPFATPVGQASSRAAAVQLAESINRYWALRGYDAEARAIALRLLSDYVESDDYGVVSNLRNGLPARRLPDGSGPG